MIKTILTCPLGGTCEKVVGDEIHRCAWYIEMEGMNPQTGERMDPQSRCVMAWIPVLAVEGNGKTAGVVEAVVNLRETVIDSSPLKLIAGTMDRLIYDQTRNDN